MKLVSNLTNLPVDTKAVVREAAKHTGKTAMWAAGAYLGYFFILGFVGGFKKELSKNHEKFDL